MLNKIFYAPGDWFAHATTRRQRLTIAAWSLILVVATIPVRFLWKDTVWMVWAISEFALVLALCGVISAETPVESESKVEVSTGTSRGHGGPHYPGCDHWIEDADIEELETSPSIPTR